MEVVSKLLSVLVGCSELKSFVDVPACKSLKFFFKS